MQGCLRTFSDGKAKGAMQYIGGFDKESLAKLHLAQETLLAQPPTGAPLPSRK
jgi:hypothetical protein